MSYVRTNIIDRTETGDTVKDGFAKVDNEIDLIYTHLNQSAADVIGKSVGSAKGDIVVFTSPSNPARLQVGADSTYLTSDSTATSGVAWKSISTETISAININQKGVANGVATLDANAKVPYSQTGYLVPVGTILPYGAQTAPDGFVICDGSPKGRTGTYANLYAVIGTYWGAGDGSTTFNVPDLRGEFLRGWDQGRGVDSGRSFATTQSGATASHSHTIDPPATATSSAGSHSHGSPVSLTVASGGSGDAAYPGSPMQPSTWATLQADGAHTHTVDIAQFTSGSSGGSETRPRNVAVQFIIKY